MPASTDQRGPGIAQGAPWLTSHKQELAAAGAVVVAAVVGVRSKDAVLKWAGEHPLAATIAGSALAGGATTGITLATLAGATPGEVVAEARDAVGTAAEWVGDHSTSLKVVGGTLAGAVVAAAVGGYLARRVGQRPPAADAGASQDSGEPATQVRDDWLTRLQQWAAGQTRTLRPVSLDQSSEPRSDDIA
jgi:hypothetical protein